MRTVGINSSQNRRNKEDRHTLRRQEKERHREREDTHTHTHTQTDREKEIRKTERDKRERDCHFSFIVQQRRREFQSLLSIENEIDLIQQIENQINALN